MGLKELQKKLTAKSRGAHVSILSESEVAKQGEWLPTPSYDLNRTLSGSLYNGVVSKTFTVIVGPEASFKSSFMCLCLAEAQKKGYTPVIIDTEGAWTPEFVSRWGLDPENMLIITSTWIEDVLVSITDLIDSEEKKLAIALDSIGALELKKMITDGQKGKVTEDQGKLQKQIKRLLKMIVSVCKLQDSVCFAAGHLYGNSSGYGEPEQIGGGKYLRLSADVIISLKKEPIYENPSGSTKKEKGNVIGTKIKAATLKNRFYPPFQEATIDINFRDGINKFAGLVDMALELGIVEKGGSWYTMPDGTKLQGEAKVRDHLEESPEEFLTNIENYLKTTGYSTTNSQLEMEVEEPAEEEKPKKKKKRI